MAKSTCLIDTRGVICATVSSTDPQRMIAEMHGALSSGASLVEVRLDALRAPLPQRWLSGRRGVVIATCRRRAEGGAFEGSEADRLAVLQAAVEAGVDWIDIEHDVECARARFDGARRLLSFHDLGATPADLAGIYRRMCRGGPDAVKVVTTAHTLADNLNVLRLVRSGEQPTVAFSLGNNGLATRLLSLCMGAPWTYAGFGASQPVVAGQPRLETLLERYGADHIDRDTDVYAVVGDPVAHSLGPLVHNRAFRAARMDRVYLALRVVRAELVGLLPIAEELGIQGLSVTMPHKQSVVSQLDVLDAMVTRLGVCNTVVRRGGLWHGHNTDAPAAVDALSEALQRRDKPLTPAEARVLVLGCGGVATAIAGGLVSTGAAVVLAARDRSRRQGLARRIGCRSVGWHQRRLVEFDVLVNATSIGMRPQLEATLLDSRSLLTRPVVLDAVYRDAPTSLVARAERAGCQVVSGLALFARQAALQSELFGGHGVSAAKMAGWLDDVCQLAPPEAA